MREFLFLLAMLVASPAHAYADFEIWLAGFREEAAAQGLSLIHI